MLSHIDSDPLQQIPLSVSVAPALARGHVETPRPPCAFLFPLSARTREHVTTPHNLCTAHRVCHILRQMCAVAVRSVSIRAKRDIAGLIRSYGARQSQEDPLGSSRLGDDGLRWVRWLKAGLPGDVWGHPRSAHSHVYALRPIGVIGIQEIDSPLI